MKDDITITEFPHSWGQNSIVSLLLNHQRPLLIKYSRLHRSLVQLPMIPSLSRKFFKCLLAAGWLTDFKCTPGQACHSALAGYLADGELIAPIYGHSYLHPALTTMYVGLLRSWTYHSNIPQGSGSVTILEAYRALLLSEFQPKNNVEFHWYSAEVSPIFTCVALSGI